MAQNPNIEFVSYSGKYPNLCSGVLVLKINGEEITFPSPCLCSGGRAWIDGDGSDHIIYGGWTVDFSEIPHLKKYEKEITECVNENVPHGCCGGCI